MSRRDRVAIHLVRATRERLPSFVRAEETMGSRCFATLILLWALLGSASAVRSQPVSIGIQQSSLPLRTVSGVVVNSVTGRPIARALVQAGQHAMLTDSDGRFEFRDSTDNALFVNKPGYFWENAGAMTGWPLAVPDKPRPLELRLV